MTHANYRQIPNFLASLSDFEGNTMMGIGNHGHGFSTGRLDEKEAAQFRKDDESGLQYVVYSYNTPIAWVRADSTKYVVGQTFSKTTTRQQNLCHAWL